MRRNIMLTSLIAACMLGGLGCASAPQGSNVEEKRAYVQDMKDRVLNEFYASNSEGRDKVENAAGYGVFSNVGTNLFVVSSDGGYGVVHNTAYSVIEHNLLDSNRHSIAGSGLPGSGYIARHNVQLGVSLNVCFEMHGGHDRGDGTDIAGTSIEIHNNTFRAPQIPVVIYGVPQEKCDVHHNWFVRHGAPGKAVRALKKTNVLTNAYGEAGKVQ